MEMLSVREAAELRGCSARQIQLLASNGKIEHRETLNEKGRKQFLIPLSALEPALQRKYYKQRAAPIPDELRHRQEKQRAGPVKPLDAFSAEEREEISLWMTILTDWQAFREGYDRKAEADEAFVAEAAERYGEDTTISRAILYRKWAAYKADDLDGLVDKRGKWKKGSTSVDDQVWRVFLTYYLDQARSPITQCIKYTRGWLKEKKLDLPVPHDSCFRRRLESEVPKAVIEYELKGKKALHDRFAPYIKRLYDHMYSNQWWVADNHTFDFMTLGADGRPHRLYLTAYIDACSTAFMGWKVTHAPCGDATIAALRDGIEYRDHGIPENLLVDNGSEFLMHDVGGRGHRTKKSQAEQFQPPPILKRLGINMVNAIPGNPEAKIIERIFRDVKDEFSRVVSTFCGGSIGERPERLQKLLKSGKVPTDEELIGAINDFIEGYYNHQPYHGAVKKNHGKPKIQVYTENLIEIRRPRCAEDLNLLLMRSSRPVKVGKRGVHLNIAGFDMDYWTDDFLLAWQGKKVYYRYDPADLTSVRVYAAPEDQYICTLPVDNAAVMAYGAASAEIKAGMKKINSYNRAVRKWSADRVLDKQERISAYTLLQLEARRNLENPPEYTKQNPRVVHLVQADEQLYSPMPKAVGELVPLDDMINNARRHYGEESE